MGRLKATLYDLCMQLAAVRIDPLRRRVVAPTRGRVLELGIGTGLNLRHYGPNATVVGVEPNRDMLKRAAPRAAAATAPISLIAGYGESLPFRDSSFDEVVVTLVLCSVGSPMATLAELHRVLKPGGTLRFLEHVRSPSVGWARVQDIVTPFWRAIADGCCPNRTTETSITRARFAIETIDRFSLGPYPTRPQILGSATRDG